MEGSEIRRFSVGPDPEHPGFSEMHPAGDGHWIRYSDHETALAKAREERDAFRAGLEQIEATDWSQPPADMPEEMARAALSKATEGEGK
jgi:hypothetical protein